MYNDKLSWKTRLRLCWDVATRGKYDPRDYKTIHQEEQWAICEQRRKELAATCRPRQPFPYKDPMDEQ
jgi:hypothetical protein